MDNLGSKLLDRRAAALNRSAEDRPKVGLPAKKIPALFVTGNHESDTSEHFKRHRFSKNHEACNDEEIPVNLAGEFEHLGELSSRPAVTEFLRDKPPAERAELFLMSARQRPGLIKARAPQCDGSIEQLSLNSSRGVL